jgi:hypothetical protein
MTTMMMKRNERRERERETRDKDVHNETRHTMTKTMMMTIMRTYTREGEGEKKKTSREGEQGRDRLTDYLYSDCNSRSSRTDCTTTTAACILSSALNA